MDERRHSLADAEKLAGGVELANVPRAAPPVSLAGSSLRSCIGDARTDEAVEVIVQLARASVGCGVRRRKRKAPVGEPGEAIAPLDELARVHGRTVLIADEVRTIQATGHLKSVHQSAEVIKDTDQSARLS